MVSMHKGYWGLDGKDSHQKDSPIIQHYVIIGISKAVDTCVEKGRLCKYTNPVRLHCKSRITDVPG